jgi:hypothetical protein
MNNKFIGWSMMILLTLMSLNVFSQGVTSSGINGRVIDENGKPLEMANVVAIHAPTGGQFGAMTDTKGNFRLVNLPVGGPYRVVVTYVGYTDFNKENIYLQLGQTLRIDAKLSHSSVDIEEVVVLAKRVADKNVFDGNRTGAETVINSDELKKIPSISGNLNDFTRLTPQANITGSGVSIAGSNNRYNAVFVDGTVNNDVFGLAANGMNGGQTGISAISFESLEQVQVVVAPYDVKMGGFAGGGINAVTKSGTNEFHGSAYFKFRNQNLAGKTPGILDEGEKAEKLADFTAKTYGATLGGKIVENKLFFFMNYEGQRDETPQPFSFNDYRGDASAADIDQLRKTILSKYGYETGGYLNNARELRGEKFLMRLDWNINSKHRLMVRHQYTKGESFDPGTTSKGSVNFYNSGKYFPSTSNTSAIELNSRFNNTFSNNLKVGFTSVRDDRDPLGANFPRVTIEDGEGVINIGSEEFSTGNQLDQDILTITDNFEIYKGNHTITIGTHNEVYWIYNMFMKRAFGAYKFRGIDEFVNEDPYDYRIGYSLIDDVRGDGSKAAADFNAFQLGFYIQDEWQILDNFKLTGGIRFDIPVFTEDPIEREGFNSTTIPKLEKYYDLKGARSGSMPKSQLMFSPRVGFNWDVFNDKTTQLRGGIGVFTSRVPFVWPAGSYTNNGMVIGGYEDDSPTGFNPDWKNQTKGSLGAPSGSQIDLYAEDFKFPQMLRGNIAVDHKLPYGIIGSLEFIYTKTLNNVLWKDVNLKPAYGNASGTPDNRPLYEKYDKNIDTEYRQIMLGDNTSKGYSYNITAQLRKDFAMGLNTSIAYTYGKSESVFDGTSSQNSSQWNYLVSSPVPRNQAELGISSFDMGHRIVGMVSYSKEFFNHLKTTVSLFYNGQSGRPFSYIYNDYIGSFTNEAYKGPQLMYIPAKQSDIVFVGTAEEQAQQWKDLNEFIEQDDYLSEHRGEYAERNAARLPFTHIFDFHFSQDIFVNVKDRRQTLQFTFDVFNLGNLLNRDWGRMYYASNGNVSLVKFEKLTTDPVTGDKTVPTFSFKRPKNDEAYSISDSGLNSSRWQAQIGIKYIF